ncbi:PKD domain-containing protein [Neolewinella lacunae]|uniref:Gliding motility-associated C-terminal domain-containing protein n=1 Tax=Neolewinella lacunae TaxID=1517758 RepID=A0A923PNT2_9BACT|nr:PKD domain-containing protein [Neolewinella lacunae]MBC6995825.1 gliding motility-associated C-terminal domain-containing protein [Neolewinella lacunae]MDN3636482.1 PKD domain-containing protein [Neolewinella lacunae]
MKPSTSLCRMAFLACLGLLFSGALLAQDPNLSFSIVNGDFTRCAQDSLVRINIVPDPARTFSTVRLFWDGDNVPPVVITNPAQLTRSFTYSFPELFDECDYSDACISRQVYGSCFLIEVVAQYTDGTSENVSRRIGFQKPPEPAFTLPMVSCTGTMLDLLNLTCPGNDTSMTYLWTLPDGSTSRDFEISYAFDEVGPQTFTLSATNLCGTRAVSRTIDIVEAPSVVGTPDSNVIVGPDNDFRVCLAGESCIRLNGSASTGIDSWRWTVNNGSGVTIEDPDALITRVCFTTPGERTFTLTGRNSSCNETQTHPCPITVVRGETLTLNPQPDACPSLAYTPTPGVDPNATYFIDGAVVTTFPFTMSARATPYVIRAEKTTECGFLVVTDTLFVDAAIQPTLVMPNNGAAFCPDTGLVAIQVSDAGGRWTPAVGLVIRNGEAFFDQSAAPGDYTFTYTLGQGACERSLTVNLRLEDSALQLPPDFFICVSSPPVSLMPMPNDGTLGGTGVDNLARTFSPAGLSPGTYAIAYQRENLVTGCTEAGSWNAEVVAEPTLNTGGPISVCNTDQTIDLLASAPGFSFSPAFGQLSFVGRGIVDGAAGTYRPANLAVGEVDTVLISVADPRTPELCATTDTLFVTITEIVQPNAGADTIICGGGGTYALGDPGAGRWSGPGAATDGTLNLSAVAPGTYRYTLTLGEGFCASQDEVTVTIAPGNGVTVAEPVAFLCDTAAMLLLPSVSPGLGGVWTGDLPINATSINVSGATPGTYNFQYTVADLPAGCNSADFRVELLAQPSTTLSGDAVACNDGSCVTFLAGGTPADTYRWRTSDGLNSSGASICHQFPQAGDYTVTVVGERRHPTNNTVLCSSAPASTSVRVLDPPEPATINIATDTLCPGEELLLSFTPPPAAALQNLEYEWRYGDTAFVATGPTLVSFPSPLEDTTFLISLNTLGTCGRAQSSFELVLRANPVANIGVVYPENCSGSELILTNLATGTLDAVAWSSSDGQQFTSFQPPVLRPVTGDVARTITYTLEVGNACRNDRSSVDVTVEPTNIRALPAFTDTTVCVGQPFIVNNISTPGTRVEYVFSDGRRFASDSVAVVFDAPGPIAFTIYAYGCGYDSSRWTGRVLPSPALALTAPSFVCPYAPFAYHLQSDAASTLLYFGDGDSTRQNLGNHFYAPSAAPLLLRYTATSSEGCRAEGSQTVQVLPQPTAAIVPPDTLCANQPQVFLSAGSGGQSCRWLFGDGQGSDGCEVEHAYAQDGLYSVQLIYTSSQGCADTAFAPAFVRPTPDIRLNLTYDSTRCGPTQVLFQYEGNLQQASSFLLLPGDGSDPLTSLNPTHRYDTSGQITARLWTGFDGLCYADTEVSFHLRQYPRARTQVQDTRCEAGEVVAVAIRTENPEDLIMGSGPEGYFSAGRNQFNLRTPGNYLFEVVSPDGCDTLIDFRLDPVRPLELSTIPNTSIPLGDSIRLHSEVNSLNTLFSWTPGASLSDSSALSPWARPLRGTLYLLEALDTLTGCSRQDSVFIGVLQETDIFVPTAFSPNGDGTNDDLRIFPRVSVARIDAIRIYSRWGNLVFEQTPDQGPITINTPLWDGRFNGRLVNPAVFVYTIEYENVRGERKVQAGEVLVLGEE